jgi:hypothetical protein
MNERIRELAEQAREYATTRHSVSNIVLSINNDKFEQKFAELIVRECVAQIEIEKGNPYRNMGDENRYGIGACVESIRRIKQHFGVEE